MVRYFDTSNEAVPFANQRLFRSKPYSIPKLPVGLADMINTPNAIAASPINIGKNERSTHAVMKNPTPNIAAAAPLTRVSQTIRRTKPRRIVDI
jgi:hypothetical protein